MKKILIVLPTFNEELVVEKNTLAVFHFCREKLKNHDWQIVIADNGSSDQTPKIAEKLSKEFSKISFFHIPDKGRAFALKKAWRDYQADLYSFMDIDLATDLKYFLPLVQAIEEEKYDLAIGSRLKKGTKTKRSLSREFVSRTYNFLLKIFFNPSFKDAQCGFKIINKKVVQEILPMIKNNMWFFDTELLVSAENYGFRIKEIPVEWVEKRTGIRKSKVNVFSTAWEDIKGIIELKIRLLRNMKKRNKK